MNKKITGKAAKIMEAYIEGKSIEQRRKGSKGKWLLTINPKWDWFFQEYRVKEDNSETTYSGDQ